MDRANFSKQINIKKKIYQGCRGGSKDNGHNSESGVQPITLWMICPTGSIALWLGRPSVSWWSSTWPEFKLRSISLLHEESHNCSGHDSTMIGEKDNNFLWQIGPMFKSLHGPAYTTRLFLCADPKTPASQSMNLIMKPFLVFITYKKNNKAASDT